MKDILVIHQEFYTLEQFAKNRDSTKIRDRFAVVFPPKAIILYINSKIVSNSKLFQTFVRIFYKSPSMPCIKFIKIHQWISDMAKIVIFINWRATELRFLYELEGDL